MRYLLIHAKHITCSRISSYMAYYILRHFSTSPLSLFGDVLLLELHFLTGMGRHTLSLVYCAALLAVGVAEDAIPFVAVSLQPFVSV